MLLLLFVLHGNLIERGDMVCPSELPLLSETFIPQKPVQVMPSSSSSSRFSSSEVLCSHLPLF
jgi:hypothetical protein